MPRKDGNSKTDKELIERIFLVLRGMTYAEIGKLLGKSSGGVGGWRTGASRPTIDDLRKIIKHTGITWDELLTGKKPAEQDATPAVAPERKSPTPESCFSDYIAQVARYQFLIQMCNDDLSSQAWQAWLTQETTRFQDECKKVRDALDAARSKQSAAAG